MDVLLCSAVPRSWATQVQSWPILSSSLSILAATAIGKPSNVPSYTKTNVIGPTLLLALLVVYTAADRIFFFFSFSDMNVFQVFSVVTNTSVSMNTASIKLLRPVCWHYPFRVLERFPFLLLLFLFVFFPPPSYHCIRCNTQTTMPSPAPFLHHRYRSTFCILLRRAFQSRIITAIL